MGNLVRVGVMLMALVAAVASASAPARHAVERAETVAVSYDAAWHALIELFAERSWTIGTLEKDSGIITTDWMAMEKDSPFVDCGGAGISSVIGTQIRFNVLVKDLGTEANVVVNASFRQLRSFDRKESVAECTSRGGVEALIHREVRERAGRQRTRVKAPAPAPASGFFCTSAPADVSLASCARSGAGCAKRQVDLVAQAGDATPCVEQATAVCFTTTVTDAAITESCHPSAAACSRRHAGATSDPTLGDVTDCSPAP